MDTLLHGTQIVLAVAFLLLGGGCWVTARATRSLPLYLGSMSYAGAGAACLYYQSFWPLLIGLAVATAAKLLLGDPSSPR